MRTTLSVDDDLLDLAKRKAVADGTSVSDVVNRALRRGLMDAEPRRVGSPTITYGTETGPRIDDAALRRHADALDDEEAQRKLGR